MSLFTFFYQIIFEGIVDNGEEGDLAVDEVTFARNQNCSFIPNSARSTYATAAGNKGKFKFII